MSDAFGQMLPFALVLALSPIPIVAVIAMLFSQRAIANGSAFLVGWVVGVAVGLALLAWVAEAGGCSARTMLPRPPSSCSGSSSAA